MGCIIYTLYYGYIWTRPEKYIFAEETGKYFQTPNFNHMCSPIYTSRLSTGKPTDTMYLRLEVMLKILYSHLHLAGI